MNAIGNNCCSSFYYKKKECEFTNPFTWAAVTPIDILFLIKHYDTINFKNIRLVDLDSTLFQNSELITSKIKAGGNIKGINVDNKITLYYTHYLANTITCEKEDIDVYCEDNSRYVKEKYESRVKRMCELPVFLIVTYSHHNWTYNDVKKLSELKTDKKIILITNHEFNFPKNVHLIKDDLRDLNAGTLLDKHFNEIDSEIEKFYDKSL